jgi:hypothetical protein
LDLRLGLRTPPTRSRRRTPRWGQAIEHGPGTTAQLTSVDLQSDSSLVTCDLASHVAEAVVGLTALPRQKQSPVGSMLSTLTSTGRCKEWEWLLLAARVACEDGLQLTKIACSRLVPVGRLSCSGSFAKPLSVGLRIQKRPRGDSVPTITSPAYLMKEAAGATYV